MIKEQVWHISGDEVKRAFSEWLTEFMANRGEPVCDDEMKPFYSRAEAMALLHVNSATLWRWGKSGYLPTTKVGGKVFYKKQDLVKILNKD